jgi:hypothetical protein
VPDVVAHVEATIEDDDEDDGEDQDTPAVGAGDEEE